LLAEATQDDVLKDICRAAIERVAAREAIISPLGGSAARMLAANETVLLKGIGAAVKPN
jgi:hypothetical protein